MAKPNVTDTKRLQGMFAATDNCFGKLYDGEEAECVKCTDQKDCRLWGDAKGDPAAAPATPPAKATKIAPATKKGAAPAKAATKAAPAKGKAPVVEEEILVDTFEPPVDETPVNGKGKGKPGQPGNKAAEKTDEEKAAAAEAKAASKKPTPPKADLDEEGFKIGSKASLIFKLLKEGKYTRTGIEAAVDSVGKSTVAIFLNDLQKPVGTYSVSRDLKVNISEAGILTVAKRK